MHSIQLTQNGLTHYIAGSDYNFRVSTAGEKVAADTERVLNQMQISPQEIYSGTQVHGVNIAYCDGKNGEDYLIGRNFPDTDGLITDQPNIALLIKYADCSPIILFDPVKGVHAALHSGWRGTVQRISEHAIAMMESRFYSKREDILAYVGPSIDAYNYQVGDEVYDAFKDFEDRDRFFSRIANRWHLSMSEANLESLLLSGLQKNNIEVSRESTFTSPALHSARQEGPDYQLNGLITMM